jgi:hypothetical protein
MSETCLERWMARAHFTCPRCFANSWNPNDIAERYCGRCHIRERAPISLRDHAPRDPVGVHKARKRAEESLRPSRHDDDDGTPSPFTFSPAPSPDPPSPPDPPSTIDPGGGDSGGGGASGDW